MIPPDHDGLKSDTVEAPIYLDIARSHTDMLRNVRSPEKMKNETVSPQNRTKEREGEKIVRGSKGKRKEKKGKKKKKKPNKRSDRAGFELAALRIISLLLTVRPEPSIKLQVPPKYRGGSMGTTRYRYIVQMHLVRQRQTMPTKQ